MGAVGMKRSVVCPACHARLLLAADSKATRVRCASCRSEFPATLAVAPPPLRKAAKGGVAAGVCILAVIGLVMSIQPVSLMSGSVTVWLGAMP